MLSGQERSEEHTPELQSLRQLVCRLLLEKKKYPHQRSSTVRLVSTSKLTRSPPYVFFETGATGILSLSPQFDLPIWNTACPLFFLIIRAPPGSPLFPSTAVFR